MVSIQNFLITTSLAFLVSGVAINDTNLFNQTNSTGYVKLDFDVIRDPTNSTSINSTSISQLNKRFIPLGITNDGIQYLVTLAVGSNKQKNTVIVDTGSSDLWFIDSKAKCEGKNNKCKLLGSFNPKTSTSYTNLGGTFSTKYDDGSGSSGTWGKDNIYVGSVKFSQRFGEVNDTSVQAGILGIGYESGEFSKKPYPNFPVSLKLSGLIYKASYSIYLDYPTAKSGVIIFGGIDTTRYSGKLIVEDITSDTDLTIKLNSLNYNGQIFSINKDALPDTGTTLTYLPTTIVKQIAKKAGATSEKNDDGSYTWYVPCTKPTGNAVFSFPNGASINVPLSELIINLGDGTCKWGIQQTNDLILLGDNFIRHAYLVFNIADSTISIAQVKASNTENVVAIR